MSELFSPRSQAASQSLGDLQRWHTPVTDSRILLPSVIQVISAGSLLSYDVDDDKEVWILNRQEVIAAVEE